MGRIYASHEQRQTRQRVAPFLLMSTTVVHQGYGCIPDGANACQRVPVSAVGILKRGLTATLLRYRITECRPEKQ